jgi:hypothetical protein
MHIDKYGGLPLQPIGQRHWGEAVLGEILLEKYPTEIVII